jgi:hypothetical protein
MALGVLAYPSISSADYNLIQGFRKTNDELYCNTPYFLDQKVIICLKRLILLDIPVRVVPLISVI